MALGDYTKTTYVNGTTPAINQTNLNNSENKVSELDTWADAADGRIDALETATIGVMPVGTTLYMEYEKTISATFPAVARNIENTISSSNYALLVPELRAVKSTILGVSDFAVTVSGSNVTFPNNAPGIAAVNLIIEDAKVTNWLTLGQTAASPATADYSTKPRVLNVAGTDYVITGATLATRVVTVTGSPTTGAQTGILYPYRITGSTTTAYLPKIAGFVGVVAGDADGEIVGGWRRMDRGQDHIHNSGVADDGGNDPFVYGGTVEDIPGSTTSAYTSGSGTGVDQGKTSIPKASTTGGTPRTGKTSDPRSFGQYVYTWAGSYAP